MTVRLLAAVPVVAAGLLLALAPAVPATAASVDSDDWTWEVEDAVPPHIVGSTVTYPDFLGTGVELAGWASAPAFDAFTFLSFVGPPVTFTAPTVAGDQITTLGSAGGFQMPTTIQFDGPYVTYTFEVGTGGPLFGWYGRVASGEIGDFRTSTTTDITSGIVVDPSGETTPLAWAWTPGVVVVFVEDGTGRLLLFPDGPASPSTQPGTYTVVFALLDGGPCTVDARASILAEIAPTLASTVGDSLPEPDFACGTLDSPPAITAGAPLDLTLGVEFGKPVMATGFLDDPDALRLVAADLPPGLTAELIWQGSTPFVHLTGTAAAADATLVFYLEDDGGARHPVTLPLRLDAALPATGAEFPTGPAAIAAGLILLGGLVLARRRRAASRAV